MISSAADFFLPSCLLLLNIPWFCLSWWAVPSSSLLIIRIDPFLLIFPLRLLMTSHALLILLSFRQPLMLMRIERSLFFRGFLFKKSAAASDHLDTHWWCSFFLDFSVKRWLQPFFSSLDFVIIVLMRQHDEENQQQESSICLLISVSSLLISLFFLAVSNLSFGTFYLLAV